MSNVKKHEICYIDAKQLQKRPQNDSSLDLENFSCILNQDDPSFLHHQINQLQMKLEDLRSYFHRKQPTDFFSIAMNEYYDRYINQNEVKSFINSTIKRKDAYLEQFEFIEEETRIHTLEKLNDCFFSQSDLIDSMEAAYKLECDPSYECGKHKAYMQKHDYLKELEELNEQKKHLKHEISKYQAKRIKLDSSIAQFNESKKQVDQMLKTYKEEIDKYCKATKDYEAQKDLITARILALEQEKMQLTKNRELFEDILESHCSKESRSPSQRSQMASPRYVLNDRHEENLRFLQILQKLGSDPRNPVDIACDIIEELKELVLAFENAEIKNLKNELISREQIMNTYIKSEKSKYNKKNVELEREFRYLEYFKGNKSDVEKIKLAFEYIRKAKKKIEEKETENQKITETLLSFEKQINNSVQIYKESYGSLLNLYRAIDSRLKMIYLLLAKQE